jgi:hypothetical protein
MDAYLTFDRDLFAFLAPFLVLMIAVVAYLFMPMGGKPDSSDQGEGML